MKYVYRTSGTCSSQIEFEINDGKVSNVVFLGGCNGNLKAISKLVNGLDADKIIDTLSGNTCGFRNTSCADQLAKAIKEAKANSRVLANNNASSVFVNYAFPKNDGSQVVEGTKDAKEVQMLVNQFISQYKQTIQNMINSSKVQENSELKRYVEGMKRKFTADFGRNMKYTRDIKDELTRHIELIEAQGDKGKTDLLSELKEYVQKFNNSNKQIEEKMNRLGIDVKSIRLKK